MQKKILSAVLALSLVGSASVAFAGGYWGAPSNKLDIHASDSFNYESDNDGYDIDVENSFNKRYTKNVRKSFSADVDLDLDITKDSNNTTTKVKQGNYSKAHIMVNQAGGGTGGGDVISLDYSINGSAINSYNTKDSYNKSYTSTYSSSSRTDIDVDLDIHDSFNKSYSSKKFMRVCGPSCK